ncbi:UNVERIFIED_CONTAM: hypothetical protein HDU68_010675 [Siphonaria sp. JEL0065]|nr:hypothetical protein HDU68_010675 [Siphonaria sp. JEL0065]
MECTRTQNILVSVVKKAGGGNMTPLDGILRVTHDAFCTGTQHARTSDRGLEIICDRSYRYPHDPNVFLLVSQSSHPALHLYFTNVTINNSTTNINIHGGGSDSESVSLYLDGQFNCTEPIFTYDSDLNVMMYESFSGLPTDIVQVLYYLAKDKFGVSHSSDTKDTWWTWNPDLSHWRQEVTPCEDFCVVNVVDYYERAKVWFQANTFDPKLTKNRELRMDHILKQLKSGPSRSVILHEAAVRFKMNVRDFELKLDANMGLIGFTNGVYDLVEHEFRVTLPTDYISMTCGYPFEESPDLQTRAEILRFFEEIQPDEKDREYLQLLLGSSLHG